MLLDMFVERECFCVGWRIVGLEEGEAEMMFVDGYVEDQTNPAHSNK